MAELTVWHNLVYSTKGGCGKTTLCLNFPKLVLQLKNSSIKLQYFDPMNCTKTKHFNEPTDNKSRIVIMDLDLAASNIDEESIKEMTTLKYDNSKQRFLCDSIITHKENNLDLVVNLGDDAMLIIGPKSEQERNYFKTKRRYIPTVRFEEFKYSILSFINKIISLSIEKKISILNIVYDLPPNSDGFTEILFDVLLNQSFCGLLTDNDIHHKYRLIMPENPINSIRNVNRSWLEGFLSNSGSNRKVDQIIILDNKALNKKDDKNTLFEFHLTTVGNKKGIDINSVVYPLYGYTVFKGQKNKDSRTILFGSIDDFLLYQPVISLYKRGKPTIN